MEPHDLPGGGSRGPAAGGQVSEPKQGTRALRGEQEEVWTEGSNPSKWKTWAAVVGSTHSKRFTGCRLGSVVKSTCS